MKTSQKKLNDTQLELRVELSAEELKPYLEKTARRISQEVSIPGFRRGHAPYDVLKRHVGEGTIYEEAFHNVVETTYPKVLDQEKLEVVGSPQVDVEKIAPGNPLIYKAVVNLLPKVTLGEYKQLKARRKQVAAGDAELDKSLAQLRQMRAKETLVTRAAQKSDRVVVDFTISLDKVAIEGGQAKKHSIILGEGQYVPGLEEAIIGRKKDEEKTTELTFPKDYHQKTIAGRKTELRVKVLEVYAREVPLLDDAFAKSVGNFQKLQELKDTLTKNISQELSAKEEQRFELELIEEIVAKSTLGALPEILLESEVKKMLHELEDDVAQRGGKFDDYLQSLKKTREELGKEFRPRAERRVKTALVAREIAVQEKIAVSSAEIDQEIKAGMGMYGESEAIKEQMRSPQYRSYVSNFLMNRKVFQQLKKWVSGEDKK